MKKLKLLTTLFIICLAIISCGTNIPKQKEVNATNIAISGSGKNYIKVVDGSYKIKLIEDKKIILPIKLKLIKSPKVPMPKMGNITLVPLDESGIAIPIGHYNSFSPDTMSDWGKIEDLLKSKTGETVMVSFECGGLFLKEDHIKKVMTEIKSFEITRTDVTSDANTYTSQKKQAPKTKNTKSKHWDETLTSYEKYIDNYIELLKKSKSGDISALSKYPEMMQQASTLSTKLQNASNNLTPNQMTKFLKLQTKLTNAATKL